MSRSITAHWIAASLVAAGTFLPPVAGAEALNAKPGAWEMTVKATMEGITIPPETLAKMPPEQRAGAEKMMGDKAGKVNTSVIKTCVRKEDLDQDQFIKNNDPDCTVATTTRTPTRLAATRSCKGPPPSKGKVSFEARSPESVVGTIDQQRTDGGRLHVDIAGKWLSASCEGIELQKAP